MDIFEFRDQVIGDYQKYVTSFIQIRDSRIKDYVQGSLREGLLWPDPLIQLNPSFKTGDSIDELIGQGILHSECSKIFRKDKEKTGSQTGKPLRLHHHQGNAIRAALTGHNYLLTTGTGSGKSLAYIIPIVDYVLNHKTTNSIRAIVVYPMNALANSQHGELEKFLCYGYPDLKGPVTFARYTGQESDDEKQRIISNPPDILLTNYVMLELILTRPQEQNLIKAAQGLRFLVLDELHTYRGRQGADVSWLVRRVREILSAQKLQCVGTSATLAGSGTYEEQKEEVARVATQLFGSLVEPKNVIGETLRRATPHKSIEDSNFVRELTARVNQPKQKPPKTYQTFINDPLSIWIESTLGLTMNSQDGRLVRSKPRSLSGMGGAAKQLSQDTNVPEEKCLEALKEGLLAGYQCEPNPETGFPPFAFRLHQFISRGDTIYASIENLSNRHITANRQQFVPGDRNRVLLPLIFCRECGQEYYCIRKDRDPNTSMRVFTPRELDDRQSEENSEPGFLFYSEDEPWPTELEEVLNKLPDDWLEEHRNVRRVRPDRRDYLPQGIRIATNGHESEQGLDCHYIPSPFRFCLSCGVSYGGRQASDFAKLSSLGSEGRSTATTISCLSAIHNLKKSETLHHTARKLLSFTDNRQDASLQAGHFNDFIEIGLLRSALYKAVNEAGSQGLRYEELTQKVFDSLNLPLEMYASNPEVRFQALTETQLALRKVIGYRLYRDLKRGWRITSPNLEQCGLLEIDYISLGDVCGAEDVWNRGHQALVTASSETRRKIAVVLLDYMRRELAIKVEYLDSRAQESIQQQSAQRLIAPWAVDENEGMERAAILFPRPSRGRQDYRGNVYLSPRGGFGQYLRRTTTFQNYRERLNLEDTQVIINDLLNALRIAGLVEVVMEPENDDQVPGYQIPASATRWLAGEGSKAFHDPIRVPNQPPTGGRTNPFFVNYYKNTASNNLGIEGREHTAQVPYDLRIQREQKFREAKLPILFCSPTMELGVDIASLNVVNLRNIPPTPANYAQRSGRAGRSGQPALVFSYCSTGSPHDQFFFRRPELMVSGAVSPPRLDLANEDLVRAHVHAVWLAQTGQSLGKSLKDVLDLSGDDPTLQLQDVVRDSISAESPKKRALAQAQKVLNTIKNELEDTDWYTDKWLEEVLTQATRMFDFACERWRGLYRAALAQAKAQDLIIRDASRNLEDKRQAERLRREAEAQLKLLTEAEDVIQSDFYTYRYFASEGFLPGYNFPRLPLSAFIPGRRTKQQDEFLSRPRFLAISEFGPQSFVYHEGSRYVINKVILPLRDPGSEETFPTQRVKQCQQCGYLHPITMGEGPDLCEKCHNSLPAPLRQLFRLQNVSTKRRTKINSDEEERLRLGYELRTGIRFGEACGQPTFRVAKIEKDNHVLAHLTYGSTATLWRINLGWRRRQQQNQYGFVLDTERGYWARNEQIVEDEEETDPLTAQTIRVIPYVEDRRNSLLVEINEPVDQAIMASLQAALKNAIQVQYQLEDNELAAEPLPSSENRRVILFYESSEGGAGVLRHLIDDSQALSRVAAEALKICHIDPVSGNDNRKAPHAQEDCEAACYDCLMSYHNQRDHIILDRQVIRDLLLRLSQAKAISSPSEATRAEHLEELKRHSQSELERKWLAFLENHSLRLPTDAQKLIESCGTRPDFFYQNHQAAIYVDGPPHKHPERQKRDAQQNDCMEDSGYTVIRFPVEEDWDKIIQKYPSIFGQTS